MDHFRVGFGKSTFAISVHDELFWFRQAGLSIHDYTVQFRTLAAVSGWNETALLATYRRGLNPSLRWQMAIYDDTVGLESFLQKALMVSQHLTACHTEEPLAAVASPVVHLPAPEPMQIDRYNLAPTEWARCISLKLCLYCGARFTRFKFTVTYCPGHKNLRADALSRLHQSDPSPESSEPILSPTVFVCPIEWVLDDQIRAATLEEPAPRGGPEKEELCTNCLTSHPSGRPTPITRLLITHTWCHFTYTI